MFKPRYESPVYKQIYSEIYKQKMAFIGETFLRREGYATRERVFHRIRSSIALQIQEVLHNV